MASDETIGRIQKKQIELSGFSALPLASSHGTNRLSERSKMFRDQ